jgi:predicted transcriptional regulator
MFYKLLRSKYRHIIINSLKDLGDTLTDVVIKLIDTVKSKKVLIIEELDMVVCPRKDYEKKVGKIEAKKTILDGLKKIPEEK